MIPDKICVGVGTLSSIQPAEEYAFPGWQEKPYSQTRSEEYIRKETLLEWAKERLYHYAQHNDDAVCWGQRNAFQQVIDKLNSL